MLGIGAMLAVEGPLRTPETGDGTGENRPYYRASMARTGAGVRTAATITSAKARN
jgi:hypothetical protein